MFTGVQRPVLKFSEICTFSVLYKAYLAARRGKRSRAATANYEVHLLANIVNLVYILQTKIYRPGLFRVFFVYEPKKRLVQAPAFVDKVVQHALVDNLFVKERLHIRWYGRYMDDFFLIHPDKDYLQFCLKEIRAFMASLGLELNEKTQIFPIRNGIDFLGFHTYLTEEGKVIRKLRHSSIKRMRSKLRRWEQDYPAGLVTREKILQSWQAWDAHAAHGNTWSLRQQVRDRVQNILKEEI